MIARLKRYFSNPRKVMILNGSLLTITILGNIYFQVFCIPTAWAIVLISLCFLNTTLYPVLSNNKVYEPITNFINGISVWLFLYCIIFLEWVNLFGFILIPIIGLGLITYVPHFLMIQILYNGLIKSSSKRAKKYFIMGLLVSLVIPVTSIYLYQKALIEIEAFKKIDSQELNKSFMTEKILGMGIIYHVRFCGYDGWRPPKHEPLLTIGQWFNNWEDPLELSLINRVELYKINFPDKKIKFDCSCAIEYSDEYHNDYLWN